MHVLFINTIFWSLLALIALPLLIHLFARARPPAYRFSSIEFVQRIVRHAQRIRRPRDWLLWLIRTAMILFLALLFMKPLVFADRRLAAPHEPKTVIVIVDASASMAVLDGAQSRFATACAEANDILAGLSPNDRANLIWLRAKPESVFPAPGVNIRYLRNTLRQARVHNEIGRPRDALRSAVDMLHAAEGRKEIHIVSDFQATNWSDPNVAVPSDIHVAIVRVGETAPDNIALTRIYTEPVQPLAGEPVTIFCEVRNFSDRLRRTTVYFSFRDVRDRQEIALAPRERSTVLFSAGGAPSGSYPVSVRIDEDEFPGDNARHTVLRYRPYLRVGLIDRDRETTEAWRRALDASGVMETVTLSDPSDTIDPSIDALFLAGWDGRNHDVMRQYLHRGGLMIWAPAPGVSAEQVEDLSGTTGLFETDETWSWQAAPQDEMFRLRLGDHDDPVFEIFAGGEFGDPTRGVFYGRLAVPRPASREIRTLFWYEDEVPALAHWPAGQGQLILWNIPLSRQASDWADRIEFLPFLCELVMTHRARHVAGLDRAEFEPGAPLSYRPEQDVLADDIRLRTPSGDLLDAERRETDAGPVFASAPQSELGVYTWLLREEVAVHQVINFPADESDLLASDMKLEREEWVQLDSGRDAQRLREGLDVWRYCLLSLFALAMVEAAALFGRGRP